MRASVMEGEEAEVVVELEQTQEDEKDEQKVQKSTVKWGVGVGKDEPSDGGTASNHFVASSSSHDERELHRVLRKRRSSVDHLVKAKTLRAFYQPPVLFSDWADGEHTVAEQDEGVKVRTSTPILLLCQIHCVHRSVGSSYSMIFSTLQSLLNWLSTL